MLKRLIELAPDDNARSLVRDWYDNAVAGFNHFAHTGDDSQGFIVVASTANFDELDEAFAGASEDARRILRELRATAKVYGHYRAERYFMNNHDRV